MENIREILLNEIEGKIVVELASRFNEAIQRAEYYNKSYDSYINELKKIQKWFDGNQNEVKKLNSDLIRIESSLKDLGFQDEANEIKKYIGFSDKFSKVKIAM